jgi:hypothetical protein
MLEIESVHGSSLSQSVKYTIQPCLLGSRQCVMIEHKASSSFVGLGELNMIASTHPVRNFLLATSLGMALVGFASMAFALPVYSARSVAKAPPLTLENVQWQGCRPGWRGRGWCTRWVGRRRAYPTGGYYIGRTHLLRYDSCHDGGSWPVRLGCW